MWISLLVTIIFNYIIIRDIVYILHENLTLDISCNLDNKYKCDKSTLLFNYIPFCSNNEVALFAISNKRIIKWLIINLYLKIDYLIISLYKIIINIYYVGVLYIYIKKYKLFVLYDVISDCDLNLICLCKINKILKKIGVKNTDTCVNEHVYFNKYNFAIHILQKYHDNLAYDDEIMSNINKEIYLE